MGMSLYLICDETEQYVRVADISSNRASGTPHPGVVAMFCEVHQGLSLRSGGEAPDWKSGNLGDEWTPQNCAELYATRTGEPLPTRWQSAVSRSTGLSLEYLSIAENSEP